MSDEQRRDQVLLLLRASDNSTSPPTVAQYSVSAGVVLQELFGTDLARRIRMSARPFPTSSLRLPRSDSSSALQSPMTTVVSDGHLVRAACTSLIDKSTVVDIFKCFDMRWCGC